MEYLSVDFFIAKIFVYVFLKFFRSSADRIWRCSLVTSQSALKAPASLHVASAGAPDLLATRTLWLARRSVRLQIAGRSRILAVLGVCSPAPVSDSHSHPSVFRGSQDPRHHLINVRLVAPCSDHVRDFPLCGQATSGPSSLDHRLTGHCVIERRCAIERFQKGILDKVTNSIPPNHAPVVIMQTSNRDAW